MKKILCLLLILIFSLNMLVACNKDQNMDAAVQSLKDYYKHLLPSTDNSTPITSESFTVIRSFSSQGKQYSVSWKTDSDVITVVDYEGNEDGYNNENAATVRVPSNLSANVSYKLTATITAPDGKTTANVEFNLLATAGSSSTPYILSLSQTNLGKTLYFNGTINADGRMLTTEDKNAAANIYLETVEGGYHIYFYNGNVKTYIADAPYINEKGYLKCRFKGVTEAPSTVWTYDSTLGILEIAITFEGETDTFFAGTYDQYNTISLSGSYYKSEISTGKQFPAKVTPANSGTVTPPSSGGNTGSASNMTIPEVLASAEGTVVKFTGKVESFYEEWSSYGNCSPYIVDGNGNKILVFRTTTEVSIGDVVTVVGKVTIYNKVAQIAQGSSTITIDANHVCSSWTAVTCGKDSVCVVCGAAGADKATGNHTYVDGVCTGCGASEASTKVLGTLSFSSTSNRTSWDTSKQIWAANGITLTNNKGSSTSNVADYSNPARFYKSSQLIVSATGMLKIEFTCNTPGYAEALKNSITADDGGKVFVTGSTVTVTFANPVDSYTIASLTGGQVRVNSITVYVAE